MKPDQTLLSKLFESLQHPHHSTLSDQQTEQLRKHLMQLMQLTNSSDTTNQLLDQFITDQYNVHRQEVDNYYENLTDETADTTMEPAPSYDLLYAVGIRAKFNQRTYTQLAFEVYDQAQTIDGTRSFADVVGKLAARHKGNYEQLLPVAEQMAKRLEAFEDGQRLGNRQN